MEAWGEDHIRVEWLDEPEEHDYTAAAQYLSLVMPATFATQTATRMRTAEPMTYYAKDVLRASQLPLLDKDNEHVARDLSKVRHGKKLSPVLLVRGYHAATPLTIADGYHRVCAAYHIDENVSIACRIVT